MAIGLYIHVPFCIKKCNYCDFISYSYDADLAASYVYALQKEIELYNSRLSAEHRELASIYIGGGTPSLLPERELEIIFKAIRDVFDYSPDIEITVEANPGTVYFNKLVTLKELGCNRLSIGVQSFEDRLLKKLGRIHDANEAFNVIDDARKAGFSNLSLDLIFGIPGQSFNDLVADLKKLLDINPEHVSAYSLKIEEGTPFFQMLNYGNLVPCDEELELKMYLHTIEELTAAGYQHYEISNFSRLGRESIHNIRYWTNDEYIGLGPAAHSYLEKVRYHNYNDLKSYISLIDSNRLPIAKEQFINRSEEISETMFLGLRMTKGINLQRFKDRFGQSIQELFPEVLDKLLQLGLIYIDNGYLSLTPKGLPLANEVFVEFL